jgi:hypothetical protein
MSTECQVPKCRYSRPVPLPFVHVTNRDLRSATISASPSSGTAANLNTYLGVHTGFSSFTTLTYPPQLYALFSIEVPALVFRRLIGLPLVLENDSAESALVFDPDPLASDPRA